MNFPFYCECQVEDLPGLPFDMMKFKRNDGFIYLLQYEGRTKVGSSRWIYARGATHSRVLVSHGIVFDKIIVSQPIEEYLSIEKQFHFLLRKIRREGTREVYNHPPEHLIEMFDLEYTIATQLTADEIAAMGPRRRK